MLQLVPVANVFGQRLTATYALEFPPERIEMNGSEIVMVPAPILVTVTLFAVNVPR